MSASPNPNPDPDHAPDHAHGHEPGHAHHHGHGHACCGHDHSHDHAAPVSGPVAVAKEQEWTRRFFLFLELAVLLVWAVMMVWFYASGRINMYLIGEGSFRIQVLIGGLLLAVLGFFNWQMRALPADCGHDHGPGEPCGHDHDHDHDHGDHSHGAEPVADHHHHEGTASGRGMALALLALSVTAAVAMTPDEFSDGYKKNMLNAYDMRPGESRAAPDQFRLMPEASSASAAASGGISLATIEKYQPRNKDGNFDLDVMQLYYSGSDPEYAKVMKGQGVETIGQVVKDTSSTDPGKWRVFVLQMNCCAADARPYSIPVEFSQPLPALQEMGWFKIKGTIDYADERGVSVAVLKGIEAQPSLRPKEQRTLF